MDPILKALSGTIAKSKKVEKTLSRATGGKYGNIPISNTPKKRRSKAPEKNAEASGQPAGGN